MSEWYWVKIRGEWFPAVKDAWAVGGWSNQDTWEDFDHEVEEAVEIPYPNKLPTTFWAKLRKLVMSAS